MSVLFYDINMYIIVQTELMVKLVQLAIVHGVIDLLQLTIEGEPHGFKTYISSK